MPTVGVGVTVLLASLLTVYNYASGTARVFETLVLVTTFTATVPYLLATAAQLYHLLSGQRDRVDRARLVRDLVVASVAAAFSLWLVSRRRIPGRLPGCAVPLRRRAGVRRHGGPQAAHA